MRRKKNIRRADISLALDQIEILDPVAKAAYDKMRKQIRGTEIKIQAPAQVAVQKVQKEPTKEKQSIFSMLKSFIQKVKSKNVA